MSQAICLPGVGRLDGFEVFLALRLVVPLFEIAPAGQRVMHLPHWPWEKKRQYAW